MLKLVDPPSENPVTLTQAKAHLREDSSDFDDQITAFIEAATQHVDGPKGFLGRALIEQQWDLYLDRFPGSRSGEIEIPLPPLISIDGVFYTDASGVEQQFAASNYTVDDASEPARIALKPSVSWPTPIDAINAVRIRFTAGYEDGVPGPIKAAILLLIGNLYQNRETMVVGQTVETLPWAAIQLLRPYRVYLSLA